MREKTGKTIRKEAALTLRLLLSFTLASGLLMGFAPSAFAEELQEGEVAVSEQEDQTSAAVNQGDETTGQDDFVDSTTGEEVSGELGVMDEGEEPHDTTLQTLNADKGNLLQGTLSILGDGNDINALDEELPEYTINSLGTLIAYNGTAIDVVVPTMVDGIAVTNPGNAFARSTTIKSIMLPEGVTTINTSAFTACTALESITFPNTLTTIGGYAFYGCTALKSITIPGSVEAINGNMFGFSGIESIVLLEGVKSIGGALINNAAFFREITVPASVTSIADNAFNNRTDFIFNAIAGSYAAEFWALATKDTSADEFVMTPGTHTLTAYRGAGGDVVVPSGVWSIAGTTDVFRGKDTITSVVIPEGVTSIASNAFDGCTNLKSVTLPSTLTTMGTYAFQNCIKLGSIIVPGSVGTIPNYAFSGCSALASLTISEGTTRINNSAFANCTGLTHVFLPTSLNQIADNAFNGCTNISLSGQAGSYAAYFATFFHNPPADFTITPGTRTVTAYTGTDTVVTIPEGVAIIGMNAFKDKTTITEVRLPNTLVSLANNAFQGCTALKTVKMPAITTIGNYAFDGCTSLSNIVLPLGLTNIGDYAFRGCSSLPSINFPNTIVRINQLAFANCTLLTSVYIPANSSGAAVTLMGSLFSGCTNLTSIDLADDINLPELWAFFANVPNLTSIEIPTSVTLVRSNVFLGSPNLRYINVALDNPYYTSYDGVLYNKDMTVLIAVPQGYEGHFTVPDSVLYIGEKRVYPEQEYAVESGAAFQGCTKITGITLGANLKEIYTNAFKDCTSITEMIIPPNITYVGDATFTGCTNLERVVFYGNPAFFAFADCPNLKEIVLIGTDKIDSRAFGFNPNIHPDLVLVGEAGSFVEKYAQENGFAFKEYVPPSPNPELPDPPANPNPNTPNTPSASDTSAPGAQTNSPAPNTVVSTTAEAVLNNTPQSPQQTTVSPTSTPLANTDNSQPEANAEDEAPGALSFFEVVAKTVEENPWIIAVVIAACAALALAGGVWRYRKIRQTA